MTPEKGPSKLTRRDFLRILALTSAAGITEVVWPNIHSALFSKDRCLLPDPEQRLPESLLLGIAPDKNNISLCPDEAVIINLFVNSFSDDWPLDQAKEVIRHGKLPMFSLSPVLGGQQFYMRKIGEREKEIREKAQALAREINGPCLVRPFYEMNGWWFGYGTTNNTPSDFIYGWKKFVDIFHYEAPAAKIVFSPNVSIVAEKIPPYFPGDEYFDIIGLDGYNKYNEKATNLRRVLQPNLSFGQIFGPDVVEIKKITCRPLIIAEVGTALSDPSKWLKEAFECLEYWPDVKAVVFFAWQKYLPFAIGEANWGNPLLFQFLQNYSQIPGKIASPVSLDEIVGTLLGKQG